MDRNLALEAVRVTEAAAIAAARLMGRGDEKAADQAAVEAIRQSLDFIPFRGTVVVGEGERDQAPALFVGERVGAADDPVVDIAVDALEGTTITAKGGPNALSVIALTEGGTFLPASDGYMDKLAVGPVAAQAIDLKRTIAHNLHAIAEAKGVRAHDLTVVILDRPRNEGRIREVRETGARIRLLTDGDVSAAIATCDERTGIDVLLGIGGAPEGILAAAALRCVGGALQGKLVFRNEDERWRAERRGIHDPGRVYDTHELVGGESVMFAATGVTDGTLLKGIRFFRGGAWTHSVVMRSKSKTVRYIEATHRFSDL